MLYAESFLAKLFQLAENFGDVSRLIFSLSDQLCMGHSEVHAPITDLPAVYHLHCLKLFHAFHFLVVIVMIMKIVHGK